MPQAIFVGRKKLIKITLVDSQNLTLANGTGNQFHTFTANLGPAAVDRLIVSVMASRRDATDSIQAASIAGIPAARLVNVANSGDNLYVIAARVAAGTSGVIQFQHTINAANGKVATYAITGQTSDTPVINTGLITTAGTVRGTTQNLGPRHAILGIDVNESNGITHSWNANITEDVDGQTNNGGAYIALSTASRSMNGAAASSYLISTTTSAAPTLPKFAFLAWA